MGMLPPCAARALNNARNAAPVPPVGAVVLDMQTGYNGEVIGVEGRVVSVKLRTQVVQRAAFDVVQVNERRKITRPI